MKASKALAMDLHGVLIQLDSLTEAMLWLEGKRALALGTEIRGLRKQSK